MRISVPTLLPVFLMACLVVGGFSFASNPVLCVFAWGTFVVTAFVVDTYVRYRDVTTVVILAASLLLAMMFMAWTGFSYVFNSPQLTIVSAAFTLGAILWIAMYVISELMEKYQPRLQTSS